MKITMKKNIGKKDSGRFAAVRGGYTLIEMAVAMIIIGIVVAGGSAAYTLYLKKQRLDTTQSVMLLTETAIGGFRSLYGRYPCPASPTARPGDADYGYEDCSGASLTTATSVRTGLAQTDIWIGSVPFRQMNLSEKSAQDGYGNRLTYAVTRALTDDATFDPNIGGLTIDGGEDGESVVTPPHSGHFIVISHGPNGAGAVTRDGVALACPGGRAETENCNGDHVFRAIGWRNGYDDIVSYSINMPMSEWQFASDSAHMDDIHLRRTDKLLMLSEDNDENTPDAADPAMAVRGTSGDSTNILVQDGVVRANELCNDGAACFEPHLVGGSGMRCAPGEYLYAIANGGLLCSPEVYFTCPVDSQGRQQYFRGFDGAGRLICSEPPGEPCGPTTRSTFCGDTRNIPAAGSGRTEVIYSGMCHLLPDLTPAEIAEIQGLPNAMAAEAYITALNNRPRQTVYCGDIRPQEERGALVRDTYFCEDGSWRANADRSVARGGLLATFPGNHFDVYPGLQARQNPAMTFNPADPMARDPNNNSNQHSCWCREDYDVEWRDCPGGSAGNGFSIAKHRCPQTSHEWQRVVEQVNNGCACTGGNDVENVSCAQYYDVAASRVTGTVTTTTPVTCVNGAPVRGTPVVTHNCQCPAQQPTLRTEACPEGRGNSFTYGGQTYNNVERIYARQWQCPGGPAPQPVNSAADIGNWVAETLVHTQSCDGCLPQPPRYVTEACPAGTTGSGVTYRIDWDCARNDWHDESERVLVSNNCSSCVWRAPSGTPTLGNVTTPNRLGNNCTNCGATGSCWAPASGGQFYIYSGCSCGS